MALGLGSEIRKVRNRNLAAWRGRGSLTSAADVKENLRGGDRSNEVEAREPRTPAALLMQGWQVPGRLKGKGRSPCTHRPIKIPLRLVRCQLILPVHMHIKLHT